jgi:hypothetical protein
MIAPASGRLGDDLIFTSTVNSTIRENVRPRGRRYFYAFAEHRPPGWSAQIVENEPLTKSQLRAMGISPDGAPAGRGARVILYATELKGPWRSAPLGEIIAEFERRRAVGNLPPSNLTAAPKKAPGSEVERRRDREGRQ